MKMPINCPICNDIMLSNFSGVNSSELKKTCKNKIDHFITYTSDKYDYGTVIVITLRLDIGTMVWEPELSEDVANETAYNPEAAFRIVPNQGFSSIELEYFEPDFSNFQKLLAKLKTYITFA
jgi:hypothetical protein